METAAAEEKKRKAAVAAGIIEPKKRPTTEADRADVKRVKLEPTSTAEPPPNSSVYSFDFSTLPAPLITDLIVANLEAFTEPTLIALIQAYRQRTGAGPSSAVAPAPAAASVSVPAPVTTVEEIARPQSPSPTAAPPVKEEPVDPLQMDIDQDELEYEPDRLNEEVNSIFTLYCLLNLIAVKLSGRVPPLEASIEPDVTPEQPINLSLSDFKLPSPKDLVTIDSRIDLITKSIKRIYNTAVEMRPTATEPSPDTTIGGPLDMWMLLTVRMITRVAEPPAELKSPSDGEDTPMDEEKKDVALFYERQDRLRKTLCDYIISDFPGR